MQPLLVVEHGNMDEIASGVDAFARFYVVEFYQDILASAIKKRRLIYLGVSALIFIFMVIGITPIFINPTSIFAYILLILSAIMLAGIIVCLLKVKNAPKFCKENIGSYFGSQLSTAKTADRAVRQTIFKDEHIEVHSGNPAKQLANKTRLYQDIPVVFETDDIFYFKGVGWVHKERLSQDQLDVLRSILDEHFKDDRFVFRDVVLKH
jgi:hypothetical protein